MPITKNYKPIFQNLTALSHHGNTLIYDLLLLNNELCVKITKNSGGGEFDKHIYPAFVEDNNDVNGYRQDNFMSHQSSKAPQPAFLNAIRNSIRKKLTSI